jgi:hypothetical protein
MQLTLQGEVLGSRSSVDEKQSICVVSLFEW